MKQDALVQTPAFCFDGSIRVRYGAIAAKREAGMGGRHGGLCSLVHVHTTSFYLRYNVVVINSISRRVINLRGSMALGRVRVLDALLEVIEMVGSYTLTERLDSAPGISLTLACSRLLAD